MNNDIYMAPYKHTAVKKYGKMINKCEQTNLDKSDNCSVKISEICDTPSQFKVCLQQFDRLPW